MKREVREEVKKLSNDIWGEPNAYKGYRHAPGFLVPTYRSATDEEFLELLKELKQLKEKEEARAEGDVGAGQILEDES